MKKEKPKKWTVRKRRTFWARAVRNEKLLIDIKKRLFGLGRQGVMYRLAHFQKDKKKIR